MAAPGGAQTQSPNGTWAACLLMEPAHQAADENTGTESALSGLRAGLLEVPFG